MRLSLSLLLLLGVSWPGPAPAQPTDPATIARRLFVSPAGEPFRRVSGAPQPMRAWFEQADTDRDGALTLVEFQADFARWFASLDTDRDGEIEPDEVARYEHAILPEMRSRFGGGFRPGMNMGGGRSPRTGGGGTRRTAVMAGAAPFGLLPISHPVMDADLDFNRGVSPGEFSQAAGRRFLMLDTQRAGRLTLEQLAEGRREAFQSGRRDSPGLGPAEADSEDEPPRGD